MRASSFAMCSAPIQDIVIPTMKLEPRRVCSDLALTSPRLCEEGSRHEFITAGILMEEETFTVIKVAEKKKKKGDKTYYSGVCAQLGPSVVHCVYVKTEEEMVAEREDEEQGRRRGAVTVCAGFRIPYGCIESVTHSGSELVIVTKSSWRITLGQNASSEDARALLSKARPGGFRQGAPLDVNLVGLAGTAAKSKGMQRYESDLNRIVVMAERDEVVVNSDGRRQSVPVDQKEVRESLRMVKYNDRYQVCSTYPRRLLMPESCTEQLLMDARKVRSSKRFPAATWACSRGCLFRSSQPSMGFISNHSQAEDDVQLCRYFANCSALSKLHVLDCRPKVSAIANVAKGGGYETETTYSCTLEFCGIDNIFGVKTAYNNLLQTVGGAYPAEWMGMIKLIIATAIKGVNKIIGGSSVLVHCSDGWDRTAQVDCIMQVMLDPYYRTFDGICTLIEKEWCQFGHNFDAREGVFEHQKGEKRAPVFLQFVDALRVVMEFFPTSFEYSDTFLVTIVDAFHSQSFSNFVLNSEREREVYGYHIESTTPYPDVWGVVLKKKEEHKNWMYAPPQSVANGGVSVSNAVWMEENVLKFQLDLNSCMLPVWKRYFFRHEEWTRKAADVFSGKESKESGMAALSEASGRTMQQQGERIQTLEEEKGELEAENAELHARIAELNKEVQYARAAAELKLQQSQIGREILSKSSSFNPFSHLSMAGEGKMGSENAISLANAGAMVDRQTCWVKIERAGRKWIDEGYAKERKMQVMSMQKKREDMKTV